MIGWAAIFILMFATALALLWLGRLSKGAMFLVLAALFVGVAGYSWQGSPWLAGSPAKGSAKTSQEDASFAIDRALLMEKVGASAQILDAADAMHRAGLDAYGVALLRGGLEKRPRDPMLLIGLGNALFQLAGGQLTPAAELAYARAAAAAPGHPAPPYFLGLAHAEAGDFERAGNIWAEAFTMAPETGQWRPHIAQRLLQLQVIMADAEKGQIQGPGPAARP